jgi:hypothetical protein
MKKYKLTQQGSLLKDYILYDLIVHRKMYLWRYKLHLYVI